MSRDGKDPLINEGNLRLVASPFPAVKFVSHLPQKADFSKAPPIWQTLGEETNFCPLKKGKMLQASGTAPFPIAPPLPKALDSSSPSPGWWPPSHFRPVSLIRLSQSTPSHSSIATSHKSSPAILQKPI